MGPPLPLDQPRVLHWLMVPVLSLASKGHAHSHLPPPPGPMGAVSKPRPACCTKEPCSRSLPWTPLMLVHTRESHLTDLQGTD